MATAFKSCRNGILSQLLIVLLLVLDNPRMERASLTLVIGASFVASIGRTSVGCWFRSVGDGRDRRERLASFKFSTLDGTPACCMGFSLADEYEGSDELLLCFCVWFEFEMLLIFHLTGSKLNDSPDRYSSIVDTGSVSSEYIFVCQ